MVKNRVLYSIAFLAWWAFPLFAVEEELGQYGESYFRYQSLDELKPFVVLSVASPHELGLTQERLTGLKIAYEIFERSQDKSEQDRSFGRQLRDYEPLVRMLLDLDVHRPLGAVLFASEETMYPFLFFHKKTDHSTAELQSVTLWNRTFLSEPDLELGVTRRSLFQWKSQGKLAFVTVSELGQAIPNDEAAMTPYSNPGELLSLTVTVENAPEQLFYGLLLAADFAIQYGDLYALNELVRRPGYYYSHSLFPSFNSLEVSEETRPLYLALTREARAYLKEIKEYRLGLRQDSRTGNYVAASSFEYVPGTAMEEQRKTRQQHLQTLGGFYQPDDAIFAFGDGGAFRLRQQRILQAILDGFFQLIKQSENTWYHEHQLERIKNPTPMEEFDEETQQMVTVSVEEQKRRIQEQREGIDFTKVDADNPAKRTNTNRYGFEWKEILLVEENIPYFEKQLAKAREFQEAFEPLSEFITATAVNDWQETAGTLNEKGQFFGAVSLKKGNLFADFLIKSIQHSTGNSTAPQMQSDYMQHKGYRFFSLSSPPPSEEKAEDVGFFGGWVKVVSETSDEEMESSLEPAPLPDSTTSVWTPLVVQDAAVPICEEEMCEAAPGTAFPVTIASSPFHPFPLTPIDEEAMKRQNELLKAARIERRTLALENMPPEYRGRYFKFVFAVSDDAFCYAIGLDDTDLEKTLCEAIDRSQQARPFGETLLVFHPKKYGDLLASFAPLFLEASEEDYHSFVRELQDMRDEETLTISSIFEGTKRTDTLNISRDFCRFYLKELPSRRNSLTAPFSPPYFEAGGSYEIRDEK